MTANAASLEKLFPSYSGGKDFVHSSIISELVRELGYAPSNKELDDFKRKLNGQCDLPTLKDFLSTIEHPEDTHHNLVELFKFYDQENTGKITKKLLERILTNVGEGLTPDELNKFFEILCDDAEQIAYEDLVDKLLLK